MARVDYVGKRESCNRYTGMRELGNMEAESGIGETFEDIQALALECQFRDCVHVQTEGCAVIKSVETGVLPQERYDHYVQLMSEMALFPAGMIEKREQRSTVSSI